MFGKLHTITRMILPNWIYQRLIGDWNNHGFKKYFRNTGWVAVARIITLVISFLTITLVARYLGPENYGNLSYAQNFVAIFSAFAVLGIDQILYRDLVAHPEKETELLGTAFLMRLIFGALTLVVTIITAVIINEDTILNWMIGIITLTFLLQPFGVISHVFNARVLSKYNAYITIGIAFIIPSLKLLVIFFDKGILYFSAIVTIEALAYLVAYIFIYQRFLRQSIFSWTFSFFTFTSILRDSWPLLLASLSGYIYGRIDQIMIQQYIDSSAVGFYDIAVRLTELLGFLPGIIIASLFPAIINARKSDLSEYKKRLWALTILCLIISFLSALTLYLLAPFIITLLFGNNFFDAIGITRIYVWSTLGTIAIILMQQYFIVEHHSRLFLIFSILGAGINIGLNTIFIPLYGINGAAYATLITLTCITSIFLLTKRFIFNKK